MVTIGLLMIAPFPLGYSALLLNVVNAHNVGMVVVYCKQIGSHESGGLGLYEKKREF